MAKGNTTIIRMESTATIIKNGREKPTRHSITTTKNSRTNPDKLELNKYDPIARKHAIYKEKKK